VWRFFPSVTYFSKYDSFFQVWPIFFCLAILLKRVSQKAAYHISCERRRISGCRLSPLENLSNFDRLKFCISSASRIFLCNGLQTIPKRVTTITVFLSRRLEPWWPRWIHEPAICIGQLKYITFCDVSFEKRKEITFDELSWLMKPFARRGRSNLSRIEWQSANLIDWGEQNMDLPPCPSSRHPFFDRISRDAYTAKPLVVILTILTHVTRLYMVGDLVYRIKLFCQMLNGSYTTNTHKLCSYSRFVIWLARAPWRHRKLEPMSCWEFQTLMNLVMSDISS